MTKYFTDTKVANLTLATTEKYKDKQGNLQDATEWHNLQVWGKLAEIVEKYVKKGAQIYVEGKIKQESYESEKGGKKYVTKIIVSELRLLGKKESNEAPAESVAAEVNT